MALANHVISFYLYLFKFNLPLSTLIFVASNYMINSKLMTTVTCEHLLRYISLHWMSGLFFGSSQHICVDLVLPWKPVKNGCFKLGGSECVSPFVHCLFCLDLVTFNGAWFLSTFFCRTTLHFRHTTNDHRAVHKGWMPSDTQSSLINCS